MEYYSAIKKNIFESVLMRWMKLPKFASNNSITCKEHCNTFGLSSVNCLPKGKNQYRCVCVCVCVCVHLVISDSLWPMNFRPQDSSVHGIFQTRILEWVAISYSRGWSQSRDGTRLHISSIAGEFLTTRHHTESPRYRGNSDGPPPAPSPDRLAWAA